MVCVAASHCPAPSPFLEACAKVSTNLQCPRAADKTSFPKGALVLWLGKRAPYLFPESSSHQSSPSTWVTTCKLTQDQTSISCNSCIASGFFTIVSLGKPLSIPKADQLCTRLFYNCRIFEFILWRAIMQIVLLWTFPITSFGEHTDTCLGEEVWVRE